MQIEVFTFKDNSKIIILYVNKWQGIKITKKQMNEIKKINSETIINHTKMYKT